MKQSHRLIYLNHKFIYMKKLILLTLLAFWGLRLNAQTVTLSLYTAPCDSNGVVIATFTGMTMPYDVQWYTTTGYVVHYTRTVANDTLYGYAGGSLQVYGYDTLGGASAYDTATYAPPFRVIDSAVAGICPALGTLGATIIGGTGPFTYKWEDASTYGVIATINPASAPAGNYIVRVTDMGTGCVGGFEDSMRTIIINPDFTDSLGSTAALCPALGTATAYITGGTGPFTYSWFNASTGTSVGGSTATLSAPGGSYIEQTSDALGCTASMVVTIPYIPDFTATVTATDASCTNGTAAVTVTGGTAPFSYLWSNGATTSSISGLIMGTYTVGISDAAGCTLDTPMSAYVNQTILISAPDVTTPATCINADGSITAFGSGGTPPYTYLWSNGGTTATISGLTSNWYDVTVTDANGCFGTGGDYVGTSTPIYVSYSTTPSACTSPTGTATLMISGGTAPYSITWYTTPVQTGVTATALAAGTYYFFVTDAAGCTQSGTITVPPIDVIYLSFSSTPATCLASDGSVSVYASGGVAPYTYSWSSGGTSSSLSGVPYGTYYATVTDANGCSVVNCQAVPYNSPITLSLSTSQASCLYTSDGVINATAAMGTPPYSYSMGGSSSGSVSIPGLPTGPYWIYVSDALGCSTWEYTYVDYNVYDSSCYCLVKGTVYNDANHNCIQDAGEVGIQNIQLQCSGLGYTYTNPDGNYYFLVPSGSYTVSQTVLSMYPLSPCQVNNIPVTSVAATGCHTTINFADTLDPIHDMHISTWDYTFPRPGFPYTQTTIVTNDGTVTESGILAGYKPDGQIFAPTFVPAGVFTGAPYYYSTAGTFPALTPGTGQEFLMTYNVPADIPLGTNVVFKDTVSYSSPMSNWLSDYSPWNNVSYYTATTVGSYDPNFKEVSPKGTGAAGSITTNDSVLEYMVHFQNTGSYMAENVVVKDTLSANLDWNSLRPVYMSDKCVVTIDEHGVATFTFNNIDLPASTNEPISSNAMFTYTIKQRPGLAYGTQIKNRASIYFDFNAPILTNYTLNTIGFPSGVPTTPAATGYNTFTIYPNPTTNSFNAIIELTAGGTYNLKVCDITGKTELSKTLTLQTGSQTIAVDASHLTPGVYFVTLNGNDNKAQTQKLVIMK